MFGIDACCLIMGLNLKACLIFLGNLESYAYLACDMKKEEAVIAFDL